MIAKVAELHPELAFDFALAHRDAVNQRAFAQAHIAEGSRRDVDTAVGGIEFRIKVRQQRLPLIDAWLAGRRVPN